MKISIIVLTCNSEKYLVECLDNIQKNTISGDEVIVIDNNSTDNTKSILKKYQNISLYFINKNIGISAGRNLGAELAKNKVLAFIDSDILLDENSLKKARESYKEFNASSVVGIYLEHGDGLNWHVEMNRELFASKRKPNFKKQITYKNFTTFSGGLCLINKETFNKYNSFNVKFSNGPSEDIELELKMLKNKETIIFEKEFSANHYKSHMNFKKLMKRSYKSGIGIANLIKSSIKHRFIIPFNKQWPYLPISVPIEILLFLLFFKYKYLIILLFALISIRMFSVLTKKARNLKYKFLFIYYRFFTDIVMFYGMIVGLFKTIKKENILNYEVTKYE